MTPHGTEQVAEFRATSLDHSDYTKYTLWLFKDLFSGRRAYKWNYGKG